MSSAKFNSRSRVTERGTFDDPTRLRLLESDLDSMSSALDLAFAELTAELEGMRKVLMGILVSAATASILLAINLVVQG